MTRPLYAGHESEQDPVQLVTGNAGLWYDKFCNRWCEDTDKVGLDKWSLESYKAPAHAEPSHINPKLAWIQAVTGNPVGTKNLIKEHIQRREIYAEAQGAEPGHFETNAPFVTGLGRSHPVENGFAWHAVLGVPYLPGSSVKGMVRDWVEQWQQTEEKQLLRIFGSARKNASSTQVGSVLFHDALPIEPVRLKADVMTPHYSAYYSNGEDPGDWLSPNPIPFLVVATKQPFQFLITAQNPRSEVHRKDVESVLAWLSEVLSSLGAGAKTAVGYGLFGPAEYQEKQYRERKQKRENRKEVDAAIGERSPAYIKLLAAAIEGNWKKDKNAFSREIETNLSALEINPADDAVAYFVKIVDIHFHDWMNKSHKIKKAHQKKFAERINKLRGK